MCNKIYYDDDYLLIADKKKGFLNICQSNYWIILLKPADLIEIAIVHILSISA